MATSKRKPRSKPSATSRPHQRAKPPRGAAARSKLSSTPRRRSKAAARAGAVLSPGALSPGTLPPSKLARIQLDVSVGPKVVANLVAYEGGLVKAMVIVRLDYNVPTVNAQVAIWRRLADLNEAPISDDTIRDFAEDHSELTGRDVKNLLKLATFVVSRDGGEITRAVLDFAFQYKPTKTESAEPARYGGSE